MSTHFFPIRRPAAVAKLPLASGVAILALFVVVAQAEPDRTSAPLRAPRVPERGLELPFDFKNETDIKFRRSDSVPGALIPIKEHKPFFGLGISQPFWPK
jgi:hypothetical protein